MFEKFPLMAWPAGEFNEEYVDQVKLWKEIGLTVNISRPWNAQNNSKETLLKLLDECQKYDIKLIIQDTSLLWNGASEDPEGYRAKYKQAYKDFGKHPATLGFYIGDEPLKRQMDDVLTAFKIQKEEAPELLPFLNLLPIWVDSNPPYMGFETLDNYVSYMKENYNATVLSYDRYTQMSGSEVGLNIYFKDMRVYNDIAQSLGVPMWTCLLACGHWNYATPDEGAARWQLNTALAGGCTGIIWFTLEDIGSSNAYGAAIDIFGEKTQYFDNIKNVNKYFLASTADTFKDLKLDACYHVGKSYGGYPLFEEGVNDIILDVKSLKDIDMIVSFYTHKNGDKYAAVVSNTMTANNNNFNITFNRKKCDPYEIQYFGKTARVYDRYPNKASHNFDPRRENNTESNDQERYTINLWANAGQMYLFKL